MEMMEVELRMRGFKVEDWRGWGRRKGRRKRGSEDEERRIGKKRIDDREWEGDIEEEREKWIGKSELDNIDEMGKEVKLGDEEEMRKINKERMELVDIGNGVIFVGKIGNILDRRNIEVNRIEGLKKNKIGEGEVRRIKKMLKMIEIVVEENIILWERKEKKIDNRGMVKIIGKDEEVRKKKRYGRDRRLVGKEKGCEEKEGLIEVKVGKLDIKIEERVVVKGNIKCEERKWKGNEWGIENRIYEVRVM